MARAQWLRCTALTVVLYAAAGCGGDENDKGGGDDEGALEDGGGAAVSADSGAAQDAGAASAEHDAATEDAAAPAQAGAGTSDAYFRFDTFVLKAPDLVLRVLGVETTITSDVQDMLDTDMHSDAEPQDGDIDLNMLLHFSASSDIAKTDGKLESGGALCAFPLDATKPCRADASAPFYQPPMSYANATKCEVEGHALSGACFQTRSARMTVSLPLFGPVVIDDAVVIGTWAGGGKDGVAEGWISGIVREETAMKTTIRGAVPAHLALFDIQTGSALTTFLPQASAGGWPFLAQFTAKAARFDATAK